MNITPDGVLFICSGVPLEPGYVNTIDFVNSAAQFAYFTSKQKFRRFDYRYIKDGTIRVEIPSDSLYNCNYIIFQNKSFSSKYFYAFITDIQYINNITSEITYQIDELQTWMFEMELEDVFVEREHSETDRIGDNLVPESLETGDYVIGNSMDDGWLNGGYKIVVAATFDKNKTANFGDTYNGLYSGLTFIEFPGTNDGAVELANWLDTLEAKVDGIVSIFYMPNFVSPSVKNEQKAIRFPFVKLNVRKDGVPPHNNKLHTFPYTALYVTNNQGNSAVYKFENFAKVEDNCYFFLGCDYSCNPTAVLTPRDYNTSPVVVAGKANFDEKLTLTGFPLVPWISNTFQAWLAQNAGSLAVRVGGAAVDLGVSALGLFGVGYAGKLNARQMTHWRQQQGVSAAGSIANFGMEIADVVQTVMTHSMEPNHAHNTGGGSNMLAIYDGLKFTFQQKVIKPEFVSIIDSYFDRYGYATHVTKRPNLKSRRYYNYIKTIGCAVSGDIPVSAKQTISAIFDAGITFWHNPNFVGNYSVDNRAEVR